MDTLKIYPKIKRILDFVLSILAILILWPFFLIIAGLIKMDSQGTVLFKQKRIGKNKRVVNILKFRTMRNDTPKDIPTHKLQNPDLFITGIGRFLRKASLDELPQIINILKGELSFIGPRPALWNQFDLIAERDKYGANNIYPGLTGWAQINGRDELSIKVKAKYDGEYVKKMSFTFDVKVFLMTVYSVFAGKGVKEGTDESEENFNYWDK